MYVTVVYTCTWSDGLCTYTRSVLSFPECTIVHLYAGCSIVHLYTECSCIHLYTEYTILNLYTECTIVLMCVLLYTCTQSVLLYYCVYYSTPVHGVQPARVVYHEEGPQPRQ